MSGAVEWQFGTDPFGNRAHIHNDCGGVVTLVDGRPFCERCRKHDDGAGWLRRLLAWNWHWLSFEGWPGWDISGTGVNRHPPYAELDIQVGVGVQSDAITREWDDQPGIGLFYSRDFTSDGIPFVRDGEAYRAGFWFQRTADRDAFVAKYGGRATDGTTQRTA